jgi:hypothetical protein
MIEAGKLAFVMSKVWEEYDLKFGISKKLNDVKREAMRQATEYR